MPDSNSNNGIRRSDLFGQQEEHTTTSSSNTRGTNSTKSDTQLLQSIDKGIQQLVKQQNASGKNANKIALSRDNKSGNNRNANSREDEGWRNTGKAGSDFANSMEDALWDAVLGSDFKKRMQSSMSNFADSIGVEVSDIPGFLGKSFGKNLADVAKSTPIGNEIFSGLSALQGTLGNAAGNAVTNMFSGVAAAAGPGAAGAVSALSGLAAEVAATGGTMLAVQGAILLAKMAVDRLAEAFGPAAAGAKELYESTKAAANRTQAMQNQLLEQQKERLKKDQEAIVEAEFKIIEDAANRVTEVWDAVLSTINQTQGYTKANLQDLMSNYAARLKQEGLDSVVSAADISSNLQKVLESGLSGQVAEEFSYIATKLSKAVPTEDWFSYGESYATMTALAIKNGMSQQAALEYANSQLEGFASNILYASRQLSGGFSTSLNGASSLFKSALEIANTSKIGQTDNISSVLTAVSAVTAAISSNDIASQLVDSIVNAAIGGNSSNIVALRSLAGINASNTAFLQAFAKNPQEIFGNIFESLSRLQNMSNSNFMEVAEGLSDVFGISKEALSQVDFGYLSNTIRTMKTNTHTLDENVKLLQSGESTSNADMQRIQEINKYMLDEGLSYVLDNEVARSIQENMWAEQRANEIKENTFAVDLQGAGLSFLQGIKQTIDNIINFLNPFSWMSKAANVLLTGAEAASQQADLKQLLELGKVGNGNAKELYNLTTTGQDLNLTKKYVERLGGFSTTSLTQGLIDVAHMSDGTLSGNLSAVNAVGNGFRNVLQSAATSMLNHNNAVSSKYGWGSVSKSLASTALSVNSDHSLKYSPNPYVSNTSATQASADASVTKFQTMIDDISKYVEDNKTYDEWAADSRKYGIADINKAIEATGTSENDLRAAFTAQQAQRASEYEHEREVNEDAFWANGSEYWTNFMPTYANTVYEYDEAFLANHSAMMNNQAVQINDEVTMISNQETLIATLNTNTNILSRLFDKYKEFYSAWIDYYINHSAYSRDTMSASQAASIQNAEKSEYGDAVLGLAEALTSNQVNLLDPTVQQNVLLSKILLLLESIQQNTNGISTNAKGGSLSTTLSALGLGI